MTAGPALLEVDDLVVRYPIHRGLVGSAERSTSTTLSASATADDGFVALTRVTP